MGAITEIVKAFSIALGAIPGFPPIAYENTDYTYVTGTMFLQAFHMPTSASPANIGPDAFINHRGIFQINVVAPHGQGAVKAASVVDSIISAFKAGTTLISPLNQAVRILRAVPAGGLNDNDWYIIPISIYYQAFAPNI